MFRNFLWFLLGFLLGVLSLLIVSSLVGKDEYIQPPQFQIERNRPREFPKQEMRPHMPSPKDLIQHEIEHDLLGG